MAFYVAVAEALHQSQGGLFYQGSPEANAAWGSVDTVQFQERKSGSRLN